MLESGWFRYLVIAVGAGVLSTSGCQCRDTDGAPWQLETGVDADVRLDTRDGGDVSDVVDTDVDAADTFDADTRDVADIPPDTCRAQISFDISYFGIAQGSRGAPVVTDEFVYTELEDQTGAMDGDVDVYQRHPDNVHWAESVGEDRLIAGAGGNLLIHQSSPDAEPGRPVIVRRSAKKAGPDAFSDRWEGRYSGFQQGSVRPFDGDRFAFVLENDPNATPGWVGYYDGEQVREIHIKEWTRKPVSLIPNGFVLNIRTGPLSGGGNLEVYAYHESDGLRRLTETSSNERDVVATPEAIFYNTDDRVYTADPESNKTTQIHEGTCSPVGADGRRAVFSCESGQTSDEAHSRLILGDQLFYYTGSETRRVPTNGGIVYSARIHGPHVVWAEYDEFGNRPSQIGEIWYWRVGAEDAVLVDAIGTPCRTCAMAFPDVNLTVGDGVIAWNYAEPKGVPGAERPSNGGMAEIETECR